jgi:hypothetical protein
VSMLSTMHTAYSTFSMYRRATQDHQHHGHPAVDRGCTYELKGVSSHGNRKTCNRRTCSMDVLAVPTLGKHDTEGVTSRRPAVHPTVSMLST